MTWSIVHDKTFDTSTTGLKLKGWEWYMETYLPTKGYVVSNDETGGVGGIGNYEKWYGVQKTYSSFAGDGIGYTHGYIVELEGSTSDIGVWDWDGTPGGGAGANMYNNSSYTQYIPTSSVVSSRWIVMESGENPEYWLVFVDGNLLAFNVDKDKFLPGVDRNATVQTNVIASQGAPYMSKTGGNTPSIMGGAIPGTSTSAFLSSQVTYFSTQFGLAYVSQFYGFMNQPDIALRLTGSTAPSTGLTSSNYECRTFEIDGEYWLDFDPGSDGSLLIKTGANNYNNLSVYAGMP